jgi:hypothetical protein
MERAPGRLSLAPAGRGSMERVCFLARVRPERLDEYPEGFRRVAEIFHLD